MPKKQAVTHQVGESFLKIKRFLRAIFLIVYYIISWNSFGIVPNATFV